MAYIITNSSGNRCGVSKEIYEELKDKEGYTAEIIEKEYPIDRGAGWYELSNGKSIRGEEKAIKAQKKLNG